MVSGGGVQFLLGYGGAPSALLWFSERVGWGETVYVERRISDFCDLFLTILYDLGEACGWFLMIFLLPMAAHTGSAGVCLHSC